MLHALVLQIFTFALTRAAKLANDAALAMQRTEQILCFSFFLNFLLQVSSLHYPASWPRNRPVLCRLLPCFMLSAGQDASLPVRNAPQALGFRCTHCATKFASRQAMACHSRSKFAAGRMCRSEQIFYWTCQYFIVNSSGTWYPRSTS